MNVYKRARGYVVLIIVLSAVSFLLYLWTPLEGDDLAYKSIFSGASPWYPWYWWPRYAIWHWLHVNGRFIDKLMPLAMNLPKGMLAAACAVALGLMYYLAIKVAGLKRGVLPYVLIALLALVLPWWDSAYIFAVQLNYVWVSALILGAWLLISSPMPKSRFWRAAGYAVCFCGGMAHEGASFPIVGGFFLFIVFNRKNFGELFSKGYLFAFFTGFFCTLFSPALIGRATSEHTPDASPLMLVVCSEPAVIVMWVGVVITLFFRKGRTFLGGISRSPLAVLGYATLFGTPIILVSGIIFRSGWFVTLYALIATVAAIGRLGSPRLPLASFLISAILVAGIVGNVIVQRSLWREYNDYEKQFVTSTDGAVRGNFTADDRLPWWTLRRLRGVPDADDWYIAECLSNYFRTDSVVPILITPESRFLKTMPPSVEKLPTNRYEAYIWTTPDGEYIIQPCGGTFVANRRVVDPGD